MNSNELNAGIRSGLEKFIRENSQVKNLARKLNGGTATQADVLKYAELLGNKASEMLSTAHITQTVEVTTDMLPQAVKLEMQFTHSNINDFAAAVQKNIDKKQGVKLKAVTAEYPAERVDALAQKIEDMIEKNDMEELAKLLGEPVKNINLSFVDDFIKANAGARYAAGMQTKIVRTPDAHACRWCRNLAGTFNYESLPNNSDVYKRHDNCHCLVEFINGEYTQNVHTKAKTMLSTAAVKRLEAMAEPKKVTALALELLEEIAEG